MKTRVLLVALLAAACSGSGAAPCGPDLCSGCCSAEGKCESPTGSTCGLGGSQCLACGNGQQCEEGQCVTPTCTPETDAQLCTRLGNDCGQLQAADNCGQSRMVDCGNCTAPQSCGAGALNVCGCAAESNVAFCSRLGKSCGFVSGADNCGATRSVQSCGTCAAPSTCTANVCACTPESDAALCARLGKTCGAFTAPDNCGAQRSVQSCGTCTAPQTCGGAAMANVCACAAETDSAFCARRGKNCGTVIGADNCGAQRTVPSCGSCVAPQSCGAGGVANVCGSAVCMPESNAQLCARFGKNCGAFSAIDNCGMQRSVASCGTCSGTLTCGGSGTPNVCACVAETDAALCTRLGTNCGTLTATDNCGAQRTISSCGLCTAPQMCGAGGAPNVCGCSSETDAAFCSRLGKSCGAVMAADNCGAQRSVASCGTCSGLLTCGGAGTANVCGCATETDAAFCGRLGKSCGAVTAPDNCGAQRTVTNCGACAAPASCGGAGAANVCGPSTLASVCQKYGQPQGCDLCAWASGNNTPSCMHDPSCFRLTEGLLALGDGPHVSSSTCTLSAQCGTVAYPWCTASLGLQMTAGPSLKIARATTAYPGALVMRDGIDIVGGYEPTFSMPLDPNPATNGTKVAAPLPVVRWPAGVTASISSVELIMLTPVSSPYAGVVIDGTSHATFSSAVLSGNVGATYGVLITGGDGGLGGTTVVKGSTISGGNAADSTGIRFQGKGLLAVQLSTVLAGNWYYSTSLQFDWENHGHQYGISGQSCGAVELDRSTVVGNNARLARAVDLRRCDSLAVDGGTIIGRGTYRYPVTGAQAQPDAIAGIITDSVPNVTLSGATIQGIDVDAGIYTPVDPESSFGVLMMNSAGIPCVASIAGCHIKGGTYGETRTAVEGDSVVLNVTGSDLQGSAEPMHNGNNRYFTGISIRGVFDAGTTHVITGNSSIVGGDKRESCYLYGESNGIYVRAASTIISNNTLIQGDLNGNCNGYGVRIETNGTHQITNNGTLAGTSGAYAADRGVAIYVAGQPLATVQIANNQRIIGNPSPTGGVGQPSGIYALNANLTILDNPQIVGGIGDACGVCVGRSTTASTIDMRRNTVYGGRDPYGYVLGAGFDGIQNSTIIGNAFSGCDDPNPAIWPDAGCYFGAKGLDVGWSTSSTFANNYVFSGLSPRAVGCELGCTDDSTITQCTQAPFSVVFADNACIASRQVSSSPTNDMAYGMKLLFWRAADRPLVADNIIDTGANGLADLFVSAFYPTTWQSRPFDMLNNDFVPRAGVPLLSSDFGLTATTAAAVNLLTNASHAVVANVAMDAGFVLESALVPRASGYHLDLACSLGGLGTPVTGVSTDYDAQPRSASAPTIGPDECP